MEDEKILIVILDNALETTKPLKKTLASVKEQKLSPASIHISITANDPLFEEKRNIAKQYKYAITKLENSDNSYFPVASLNNTIEQIVNKYGIGDNLYILFLYAGDLILNNFWENISQVGNFNILLLHDKLNTISITEKTFFQHYFDLQNFRFMVQLTTLLKSGCFDERIGTYFITDSLIRIFQLKPTYKVITKELISISKTETFFPSLENIQYFYYKHHILMNESEKNNFFNMVEKKLGYERNELEVIENKETTVFSKNIDFSKSNNSKEEYQFVIGFISDNAEQAMRLLQQIEKLKIFVDLILIVQNTQESHKTFFDNNNPKCKIIEPKIWKENLADGKYGNYFKKFKEINSIPLGRTILQYHLFLETMSFENPVYWIIDDDISFTSTALHKKTFNIFDIISEHKKQNIDVIIGGISKDPPVPTLSSIRTQLIDFWYSSNSSEKFRIANIYGKVDYYYDLSDTHRDHIETPIYHDNTDEKDLKKIFQGKSVSRPSLERNYNNENQHTITRRGANTIVLNRAVLQNYPVINIEANNKLARRGDMLWALLNQCIEGQKIIEHSFAIDHERSAFEFSLEKELEKMSYDIIGYAFNKAFITTFNNIAKTNIMDKDNIGNEKSDVILEKHYMYFFEKRLSKFIINYFRIIGLLELLSNKYKLAKSLKKDFTSKNYFEKFLIFMEKSKKGNNVKKFINNTLPWLNNYANEVFRGNSMALYLSQQYQEEKNIVKKTNELFPLQTKTRLKNIFLFSTSQGLFYVDLSTSNYRKILDGKCYGITKYKENWIVACSGSTGYRDHIVNNRFSDIYSIVLNQDGSIKTLKKIIYGIPAEVHQIDCKNDILYIPHTDFSQLLYIDIKVCMANPTPKSIEELNHYDLLDLYKYSHLNSIYIFENTIHLISHNYTMKTNKKSQIIQLDKKGKIINMKDINAHSAHNIFVTPEETIYCDSGENTLHINKHVINFEKLTRGLSITEEHIFVGGSHISFKEYERFSSTPSIYVIDRTSKKRLYEITFEDLGNIYEIRQISEKDFSLSEQAQSR